MDIKRSGGRKSRGRIEEVKKGARLGERIERERLNGRKKEGLGRENARANRSIKSRQEADCSGGS